MSDPAEVHPRELLSAYLDDELDVEARSNVDRHLAACEDCRAQLAALGRLARAVAGEDVPPMPADLAERTGRRLDAATVVRSRRFGFVLPASIAATIAAVGILVAVQWRQGRIGDTALPVPQSKEEAPARSTAAAPVAPPAPRTAAPLEDKSFDRLEKDQKQQIGQNQEPPPTPQVLPESAPETARAKAKPDEVAGGVPGGAVGGVEGGVPGGVTGEVETQGAAGRAVANERARRVDGARERDYANAPASPTMQDVAAKSALIGSPCAEHWSDSGVHGSLRLPDREAFAELTRIAGGAGGAVIWRGASNGQPIVLAVPRDRFGEVLDALRARGVAGLPERPALPPGDDCTGISVVLSGSTPAP